MEYLEWLIIQLYLNPVRDLSYKDYDYDIQGYFSSFEEMFYEIDVAINEMRIDKVPYEKRILSEMVTVTLVEYRHNCKRGYLKLNDVVDVLLQRTLLFYTTLNEVRARHRVYYEQRYFDLLSDIPYVLELLIERNHTHIS